MRIFAPAKVNLHLAVGEPRDDGYHDVTTVLQTLAFGDTVMIEPDNAFGFACQPDLGLQPQDNLACQAAMAMAEWFGRPLDVSISVEKRVPSGAGLGGASADAAATIVGLAHLWDIDTAEPALTQIAASLGADVPFFLTGGAALYTGRGDVMERVLPSLEASVVLVKPAEPVSTAQAYAAFDRLGRPAALEPDGMIAALEAHDVQTVASHLSNNMTKASLTIVPGIAGALRLLAKCPGVLAAVMAGSGSAVFGICSDAQAAAHCARVASDAGLWSVATRTHPAGCQVS